MFCSISGEVPQVPVVSPNGHLYEKSFILKYLNDYKKDPVTSDPLSPEQLVDLKLGTSMLIVTPRPPTANSLPSLLSLFQNEWDSVVLETYQLKQQYNQVRQELSNAYYEVDAAKRVIARLVKERDEARSALAEVSKSLGAVMQNDEMEVDETGNDSSLPKNVQSRLEDVSATLSNGRIKRKKPASLASVDSLSSYSVIATLQGLHTASNPGILSLDLLISENENYSDLSITAGKDGSAHITSWRANKNIGSVKVGKKCAQAVWFDVPKSIGNDNLGSFFTTGDKVVKMWELTEEKEKAGKRKVESLWNLKSGDETIAIAVHPSGNYLLSAATNASWGIIDIENGKSIKNIINKSSNS
ncbi:hypothetical protein HK096_011320, partial [Nowakowskiella sp. JEL0078]